MHFPKAPGEGLVMPEHNPPVYAPPPVPTSGYRIPLSKHSPFPAETITGKPPFYDADRVSPVFIGSAIFPNSVHPCKIAPALDPKCMVPYGGTEHHHHDRYVSIFMPWVARNPLKCRIGFAAF